MGDCPAEHGAAGECGVGDVRPSPRGLGECATGEGGV